MELEGRNRYGKLLAPDIKLYRKYFEEMCSLLGIQAIYRAPRKDKHWTTYAEISSNYQDPMIIGCIFDESPTQQTFNKLGWAHELQGQSSIIHVDYDLEGLQQGALFIIPSGLDNAQDRLFRCVKLSTSIVYPAAITCEIVPEYKNEFRTIIQHFCFWLYENNFTSAKLIVNNKND